MSIWDEIKNIANNIKDTFEENDESNENKNLSLFNNLTLKKNGLNVPNFPKFELIATKGNIQLTNKFPQRIEDFENKYVLKSNLCFISRFHPSRYPKHGANRQRTPLRRLVCRRHDGMSRQLCHDGRQR